MPSNPQTSLRPLLRSLFDATLAAADPQRLVAATPFPDCTGRVAVVGAGKASAAMARALAGHRDAALEGIVIVPRGHAVPCGGIEVVEAGHPDPDSQGETAARRILDLAGTLGEGDLLVVLVSGGGSALLAVPAAGLVLDDKRAVAGELMRRGAPISDLNAVRKHLSAVKGGRLALAAWPARVLALAVSDVPGDSPATIASGPTVADPTDFAEAREVLARFGVEAPARVAAHLREAGEETPKPGDPRLARSEFRLLARPADGLAAAAEAARSAGYEPVLLGDALEGEARELAREHAAHACRAGRGVVLLSGGEATVTIHGKGVGGPNAEFALALALELDGRSGVHAIACDTDGIDGCGPPAGAVVGPDTLARAASLGLDPRAALADNDAHRFFEALGDSVTTGPTLTNINDFRAIIVAGR